MFNFDISNGYVILRLLVGLFIVPHAVGKITANEAASGFFAAAGFKPVKAWVTLAMVVEWVLIIGMIGGIFTQLAAIGTALFMFVASAAAFKVTRRWLWNLGGCEYPFFWGCLALLVAAHPS